MKHSLRQITTVIYIFMVLIFMSKFLNAQTIDSIRQSDNTIFKTSLVPLEIKSPNKKEDLVNLLDPDNFYIQLRSDKIIIKFQGKLYRTSDLNVLDKLIKDKKITELKSKVYIDIHKNQHMKRTKDIIKLLTSNGISRFNLITK